MKFLENVDFDGMKMELIGTFAIVYMGGWAYINFFLDTNDFISVGISHLFSYALFIWAGFSISGGLYNPALTGVLIYFKRLNLAKGLFYVLAQLIGSLLAASLLKLLSPEDNMKKISDKGGLLGYPKAITNVLFTAIYEAVGTFLVTLVYYMVALTKSKVNSHIFGIAIGSVYFSNIMIYGSSTGGAANIARVFGPAFISKEFLDLLFMSIGSLAGAVLAGFLCEVIILHDINLLVKPEDQAEEVPDYAKEVGSKTPPRGSGTDESYIERRDLSADEVHVQL